MELDFGSLVALGVVLLIGSSGCGNDGDGRSARATGGQAGSGAQGGGSSGSGGLTGGNGGASGGSSGAGASSGVGGNGGSGSGSGGLPVVPGAWGFGMETRAAYACGSDPAVLRVTNLDDSGPGSFRDAVEAEGPRVVIFETSGYIEIDSNIFVTSPCLTVAGQTAPSPGVTIRMAPGYDKDKMIQIEAHDVLVQHLRFRPGGDSCNSAIFTWFAAAPPQPHHVVFDHLSIAWAQDEGTVFSASEDSSLWRSIVSEILRNTPGTENCAGGGTSGGHGVAFGNGVNLSGVQNLLAHNVERNFMSGAAGANYVANNVIYDPGAGPEWIDFSVDPNSGTSKDSSQFRGSAEGNYLRRGPNPTDFSTGFGVRHMVPGAQLYLGDNEFDNGSAPEPFTEFVVIGPDGIDPRVSSPPITLPGYSAMSPTVAFDLVLANAGARPADRDSVDVRVVEQVKNRTGGFISHESEVGGYPSLEVKARKLVEPSNPHADDDGDGYTNLEEWLHAYAAGVEGTGPNP